MIPPHQQPADVMPQPNPMPHSQPNIQGPQGPGAMPQTGAPPPPMTGQQGGGQSLLNSANFGQVSDPLLKQVQQGIEERVPPENQKYYNSIVMAGMDLMTNEETGKMFMQALEQAKASPPQQKPQLYGHFVAKLVTFTFNQTMEGKPEQEQAEFIKAAPIAGLTLMTYVLQFAEAVNGQPIDNEMLSETARQSTAKTLQGFGVTEQELNDLMASGEQEYTAHGGPPIDQEVDDLVGDAPSPTAGMPPGGQPPPMMPPGGQAPPMPPGGMPNRGY